MSTPKYNIKSSPKKAIDLIRVTRIEVKQSGKSRSVTLVATDTMELRSYLKENLSDISVNLEIDTSITESPNKKIRKCSVQVYNSHNHATSNKDNFTSFTCYGIDYQRVYDMVLKLINKS